MEGSDGSPGGELDGSAANHLAGSDSFHLFEDAKKYINIYDIYML